MSLVSNHSRSQLMIAEHRIENGSLVSLLWLEISDLDQTADHLQDLSIPTASYIVIYSACSTILSDYAHKEYKHAEQSMIR